ncbi:MAG TPA: hypothetical protein VMV93_03845 [Chloroflexota bacterium]|nr:hypothetical protein [Chloroflexota bacterium]
MSPRPSPARQGSIGWTSLIVGLVLCLVGGVWAFQGAGVLLGSFMTSQRQWLIIGLIVLAIGIWLAYRGVAAAARRH